MIGFEPDADLLSYGMIVMAGHQRQCRTSAGQAQGIQDIRATKGLVKHRCPNGTAVVMDDVVGTHQHGYRMAGAAYAATVPTLVRNLSR